MYVKRVLPNGVRIISERLDNVRTVSVGIWVGNGSRYEPAELNGSAPAKAGAFSFYRQWTASLPQMQRCVLFSLPSAEG